MLPLEGIEVVAIEQAVAAPFASARLADAGAHVVKIERPEGDFARGYDDAVNGQSSYFVWLNRGKESCTLDLAEEEDRTRLEALLGRADILIQNLKPGALARLGFEPARLRRDYPGLILCSISGYGEHGPMSERKAYDLLIQAESGLCSVTGSAAEPARVGISIVDIASGATAHAAILEALIRRSVSGEGAEINVSMFSVMADWLAVPLLNHEAGNSPRRAGLAHPSIAPYGAFQPASGPPILISVQSDREWAILCRDFIGEPELSEDTRFATNIDRVRNRAETDWYVTRAFARYSAEDATGILSRSQIAFACINDMAGLASHPHLKRMSVDTPKGPVSLPVPGFTFVGEHRHYGSVPGLMARKT